MCIKNNEMKCNEILGFWVIVFIEFVYKVGKVEFV